MYFQNSTKGVSQKVDKEKIELTVEEKKIFSAVGTEVIRQIVIALKTIIGVLRTTLVAKTEKRIKNKIGMGELKSEIGSLSSISRELSVGKNKIDRQPDSVLRGVPILKEIFDKAKRFTNDTAGKAKNAQYRLDQMNNKQMLYDHLVQKLDTLIRKAEGALDFLEAELERRT